MIFDETEYEKKLKEAIDKGPTFGQSTFQTHMFAVATHGYDARTYRQVLIELSNKLTALKKCRVRRKKLEAEMKIIEKKIAKQSDPDRRTILECELEDKRIDLDGEEKLIIDAAKEFNYLWAEFEKRPQITSEQFEAEEKEYWKTRIVRQAQLSVAHIGTIDPGTAQALVDMGINPVQAQLELKQQNEMITQQILQLQLKEKQEQLQSLANPEKELAGQ